ncbi:MAG: hypothetical protein AAFO69_00505 [Bacteroidota bacterium]
MKYISAILILLLTAQSGMAQFFDDEVVIDKNGKVPISVDGFMTAVSLRQDSRNNRFVLGGVAELKKFKQQKLNFTLDRIDTVALQNGDVRKTYHFKVAEIKMGQVKLQNYPVEFEYVMRNKKGKSSLVSSHPAEIGLGYLRLFSNAQVDGSTLRLEDIMCDFHEDPQKCDPSLYANNTGNNSKNNPKTNNGSVSSPIVQAPLNGANVTVRIVPCSLTSDVTQVKSQVRNILSNLNVTIEEETNVPPPAKALNRISDGMTLRYFAKQDEQLAEDYLAKLKNEFSGIIIRDENMVPYFDNPIPAYFEIWIK